MKILTKFFIWQNQQYIRFTFYNNVAKDNCFCHNPHFIESAKFWSIMKSVTFLLLIFTIILGSCSKNHTEQHLNEIETIIETAPDSALILLNQMPQEELSDKSTSAHYALLLSIALDKNYIDITNDSLICIAENYYKSADDYFRLMQSYYYHGRICYNAKNYTQSLCLMIKSFDCAEDLNNYYWKGRIAEQISNIYGANYHGKEAIHYAEISYDNLKKSGKQPFSNYALLTLARAYNNNGVYDKCNSISKNLLDSASAHNDTLLSIYSKELLATSYIGLRDFRNAVTLILDIEKGGNLSKDLRCLLGISYIELGEISKAENLFKNVEDNYDADDLSLVYEIAKKRGDLESAITILSQLYNNLDSVFAQSMNLNFSQSLTEYHKAEREIKKNELIQEKQLRNRIIIVGLLIVIICVLFFIRYIRNYRLKLEKNISIAQNLQEILLLKESNFSDAKETIRKLLASRFEIIDELCKTVYENKATGLVKKKISNEIEKLIEDFSSNKQKISELEKFVNKNYTNIIISFKSDFPNLKEADYLLFLYTSLGFSISAIALFLKEDKLDAVYNRKARLKSKIRKLNPEHANSYIAILS